MLRFYLLVLLGALLGCTRDIASKTTNLKIQFSNPNASSLSWGQTDPSTAADIDCIAALFDWPEGDSWGYCTDPSENPIAFATLVVGAVPIGSSFNLSFPSGSGLFIQIVGFSSVNGSCANFEAIDSSEMTNISAPRVLGQEYINLEPGDQSVAIEADVAGSLEIANCWGGPFYWNVPDGPDCSSLVGATTYDAQGAGTAADPYVICTAAQLSDIEANACGIAVGTGCGSQYLLAADIDLASGPMPIIGPNGTNKFTGTFDGGNHVIANGITTHSAPYSGLFGRTLNATIKDLTINNATLNCDEYCGFVAGEAASTDIDNVTVTGSISSSSGTGSYVGGIAGYMSGGTLTNGTVQSGSAVDSSGSTRDSVGGAVGGLTSTTVSNVSAWATVSVTPTTGGDFTGGIVGHSFAGTISNCTAHGSVSGKIAGGAFGALDASTVTSVYSGAVVTGGSIANTHTGGFAGEIINGTNVYSSWATGDSNGGTTTTNTWNGGFVGLLDNAAVHDSYAMGDCVDGVDGNGGFAGQTSNWAQIVRSFSSGLVTSGSYLGGFVGVIGDGTTAYTNCYWDTSTSTQANAHSGGPETGITGLSTAQMSVSGNFTGWNFTTVWFMNAGYPDLQ